ncbi:aldo/keto reductase [Desulfobacula sp.]|uniref:aldo/keto reductase n=1 Tax=Desulfobacula sp. TaxID=2593537 RepID=UPI002714B39C|nr:aldo/keto reductase [Desulfobacula sp.]
MTSKHNSIHSDFSFRVLPVIEKQVFRMGIAGNYGIDSSDVEWAAEQGANYWVWGASFKKVTAGIKEVIRKDREKHVVSLLGWGFFGWQVRQSIEKALRKLNTDYLDVFKLGWLGRTSTYSQGVVDSLLKLKQEGKIKAIGASIHDRKRAGKLALDSELDLLMIRYNAKHTGAEEDIFPHLKKRTPSVVSYTALAWQQLINPMKDIEMAPWPSSKEEAKIPPLTPELCYRFVLSNPHVHLVLTGPKNREQLVMNFREIQQGALTPEELDWIRQYGKLIKSKKKFDYIK